MMGYSLWGGRFTEATAPDMARFQNSLPFDWRLWAADITGSIAWARAICAAGVLTEDERDQIIGGLEAIRDEIAATAAADPDAVFAGAHDEDIHSYVERRLAERIGAAAGKLHTGRSRNDQVATDTRLWLRGEIAALDAALAGLIETAAARAEAEIDVLMPGYTHLQPAQPIRWSHWLLRHAWAWQRDRERLADLLRRVNVCPLGSGAVAGCPVPIDRAALAADLGFAAPTPNSIDAVSDRDYVAEFLFWGVLLGVHLSQWAEDLVLWSTREFGYVVMADAYSTGSSLMPQKKNPDALELLRGKAGRLFGSLTTVLMMLKGLPSAYDKDLQEDKEPLFDTVDTLALGLAVARGVLETLRIRPERMAAALGDELLATDLADALVAAGVPFRQSHGLVGQVVRRAEELGCSLRDVPLAELQAISRHFTPAMAAVWDFERSVEQRRATGGTARAAVLEQIEALRAADERMG
jgi:argininosuccinate lyase